MDNFEKQVNEKVTFSIDFSNSLIGVEIISSYTVNAYNESIDCTSTVIDNSDNTTTTVSIRVKGGTEGITYKITVLVTTDQNNIYEKDIMMKVKESLILNDIKQTLRITSDVYNTEIYDLIDAAKDDLKISGLLVIDEADPLTKRAIITYVKANFGYNNPDYVKLIQAYDMLKQHLSLSQDYAYYSVTFLVKNSSGSLIDEAKIIFNGETKYTGSAGTAIFYVRAANNIEYKITHEDYNDYVDNDGNLYNVDVSASTTINIVMT